MVVPAEGCAAGPTIHIVVETADSKMGFRCLSTRMTGQTMKAMPRSCRKFDCLLAGARRRVKLRVRLLRFATAGLNLTGIVGTQKAFLPHIRNLPSHVFRVFL